MFLPALPPARSCHGNRFGSPVSPAFLWVCFLMAFFIVSLRQKCRGISWCSTGLGVGGPWPTLWPLDLGCWPEPAGWEGRTLNPAWAWGLLVKDLRAAAWAGRAERGRACHPALVPTWNNIVWFLLSMAQGAKGILTQKHSLLYMYSLVDSSPPRSLSVSSSIPVAISQCLCLSASCWTGENQWHSATGNLAKAGGLHEVSGSDKNCRCHRQSHWQIRISQEKID